MSTLCHKAQGCSVNIRYHQSWKVCQIWETFHIWCWASTWWLPYGLGCSCAMWWPFDPCGLGHCFPIDSWTGMHISEISGWISFIMFMISNCPDLYSCNPSWPIANDEALASVRINSGNRHKYGWYESLPGVLPTYFGYSRKYGFNSPEHAFFKTSHRWCDLFHLYSSLRKLLIVLTMKNWMKRTSCPQYWPSN